MISTADGGNDAVLEWQLCDLVTGAIRTDLPIECDTLVYNLAQENQGSFAFDVDHEQTPANWHELLTALNTMLVLVVDGEPALAWWIDQDPTRGGQKVTFTGVTLEALAGTCNVPDLSGSYYDTQAAWLLGTTAVSWDGPSGTTVLASLADRFGLTINYTAATGFSDYDYSSLETGSVLAAWQAMMAPTQGRIEFRFRIEWIDGNHRGFAKFVDIDPRIGATRTDSPLELTYTPDGRVSEGSTVEQATCSPTGRGATAVIGIASSTGSSAIVTDPQIATDLVTPISAGGPGYPLVELRKSYDNLDDAGDIDAALLARTQTTLAHFKIGPQVWAFVLTRGGLKPGNDFDAGDTLPYDVAPSKRDPIGGAGWQRILGWTINLRDGFQVTPTGWPDPEDNN